MINLFLFFFAIISFAAIGLWAGYVIGYETGKAKEKVAGQLELKDLSYKRSRDRAADIDCVYKLRREVADLEQIIDNIRSAIPPVK